MIVDDLLNDVYSKHVCDLILITQNLFHQGCYYFRDISLNAKYLVLLKIVRDKDQFMYLSCQVYPENRKSLYRAYLDATQRTHGCLVLDLSQDTNDHLRFRNKIFPAEHPPVDYTPIGVKRVKSNYHALHVLKTARHSVRKTIVSNCDKELVNSICECVLNVLNGNVVVRL